MEIEKISLNKIKPYKNNAKIHDEEQVGEIVKSIENFGFNDPIAIDENNVIIEGHGRYMALKELLPTHPEFKTVDVIRLSHLSEEQKKAYILVHNKLTMNTGFDKGVLDIELSSIPDIDMTQFGFEIPEFDFSGGDESTGDGDDKDGFDTAGTYDSIYNLSLYDPSRTDGKYQMPVIEPCHVIPDNLIGFNYMLSSKDKAAGIHCFVDDYQFERLWNAPYKYIEPLLSYEAFLTPDFSLYLDMPMAMKIWNIYRSRLIGQFMQDMGVNVIPTLSWAEKETFDFCFDGLPKHSVVATSTIGIKQNPEQTKIWRQGMDEAIKRLEPETILAYGGKIDYNYGDAEVIYFDNEVTERMKEIKNGRQRSKL